MDQMEPDKAYRVLDVPPGTTPDTITSTFRRMAKLFHPDCNGDPDAMGAFQELHEAYRALRDLPPAQIASTNHPSRDEGTDPLVLGVTIDEAEDRGVEAVVRAVMAKDDLSILFGGTIRVGTGLRRGFGPDDKEAWRNRPAEWTVARIHDTAMDVIRSEGLGFSTADVDRCMRRIVIEAQQARETAIMCPLLWEPLDAAEKPRAVAMWSRLVGITLNIEVELGVAILQHFIWQVKRKQLQLSVSHHCMPIIVSPVQGGGKTTFVSRFLGPLEELASDPVLLSQLADPRSGEILGFPVVFVDDVEHLDRRLIAVLKGVMTAKAVNRRRIGTSKAVKLRQCATLIGTANEPICMLIADPTGHRRFVELPFRNGAVAKGGDAAVWRVVDETDYGLLWRSVNAFDSSPIILHLEALAAVQAASAPVDQVRECLVGLDPRSEAIQNITVRGGVGAEDLRLLVCGLLGEEINASAFSARMSVLVQDPAVPFRPKVRTARGNIYPFKPLN
jgi:hypothetical protein